MKVNLHLPSFDSLFISEESKENKLTKNRVFELLSNDKANQKPKLSFKRRISISIFLNHIC